MSQTELQKEKARALAKSWSELVNVMSRNQTVTEEFVRCILLDHRTLQQSIGRMVFQMIRGWADQHNEGRYDMRNEALCRACANVIEMMDKNFEHWDNFPLI